MSTQHTPSTRAGVPVPVSTATTDRGVRNSYRKRIAARKSARPISARKRRLITQWLRRTARHTQPTSSLARRRATLLHYRVAVVRADLLEIAALLERARDVDPACLTELHELLANGCDSPLYNADIHISELHATLHHIRGSIVRKSS
jgi:hypothetical protein